MFLQILNELICKKTKTLGGVDFFKNQLEKRQSLPIIREAFKVPSAPIKIALERSEKQKFVLNKQNELSI